jgi:hypothetical protein
MHSAKCFFVCFQSFWQQTVHLPFLFTTCCDVTVTYVLDYRNINHLKSNFTRSCVEIFHSYHAVNMRIMWVRETIH